MDRELTIYRGLLRPQAIRLQCQATGRFDAVRQAGQVLVEIGAVEPPYVEAMLERERQISTYVGEGFALPTAPMRAGSGSAAQRSRISGSLMAWIGRENRFSCASHWLSPGTSTSACSPAWRRF